ncbi:heme-binding protein [Glaciecola sp. SC05]|uniref:SOUL family heme-binding protein n=1 Tax=Glaciecola sp. SC05 TaxID=1987355 RepID=UPI0035298E95
MKVFLLLLASAFLAGCSVFGDNGVESAPYQLLQSDQDMQIEVRNYESMILVSASMSGDGRNSAFRKLFKYISGENAGATEIAMTAPVFMDEDTANQKGTEIAMTAPVFMNENADEPMMSFVMPKSFTLENTPKPNDSEVTVTEIRDYRVAAIKFNWTLSDSNVEEHTQILSKWIAENGYTAMSEPVQAGYNGLLTLPWLRHNELLIEVE